MSEEGTSPPRRLLALLAVAVLVLAALAYWAFSQRASSSDADGPASGSPTPSAAAQSGAARPAPSPTGSASTQTPAPSGTDAPGPLAAQDAEEVAEHALGAVGAALVDPAEATDMTQVLTGAALEAFENQRQEWESQEWTQSGAPSLEDPEILDSDPDGTWVRMQVCVDSSRVSVLDDTGTDMRSPDAPQRTLNVLRLALENGTWKLAEQEFADPPGC